MDVVRNWLENLVFYVLFLTCIEMVLPSGEIRRFIRLVLGLVVILVIIDPVADRLKDAAWLAAPALAERREQRDAMNPVTQGLRVAQAGQAALVGRVKEQLERQAAAFAGMVPGVADAGARIELGQDGQVQTLMVSVVPDADASSDGAKTALATRVSTVLAQVYGVPTDHVRVQLRATEEE